MWDVNEDRTLRMEERTQQEIINFMSATNYSRLRQEGFRTDLNSIRSTLTAFNSTQEHGEFGELAGEAPEEVAQLRSEKLRLLETSLSDLGYRNEDGSRINLTDPSKAGYAGYDLGTAGVRRLDNYRDIENPDQYSSAILPSPLLGSVVS